MSADSAVGVFDSGLGGLTVLKELKTHLPNESFIYLGDTARLPYGSKSPETISRYVEQNVHFLEKLNVKAIVIACNSASAVLQTHKIQASVPIFEVIKPGAEAALTSTENQRIGVIATWATIHQGAYQNALNKLSPEVLVFSQSAPLLVPIVEEGWLDDPLTNLVLHRYLAPILAKGIDTLILGCTHYPALKEAFRKVVGPNVTLTDSAETISLKLKAAIAQGELSASKKSNGCRLLTTDKTSRFQEVAKLLLEQSNLPELELVNIN